VLHAVEKRVGAGGRGGVLSVVGRRHPVHRGDGDLGASYVYSENHAAFLSSGNVGLQPWDPQGLFLANHASKDS